MSRPNVLQLHSPNPADQSEFIDAVRRSRSLHGRWVSPPQSPEEYAAYLERLQSPSHEAFFLRRADRNDLVGVVNLSEIVRGAFCSGYLGYYALAPHHGQGLMKLGLALVMDHAFDELRLHRLEANIQPENAASIGLVRSLGFRKEGFSPRYLKLGGEWRDHERWAITSEERPRRGRSRRGSP